MFSPTEYGAVALNAEEEGHVDQDGEDEAGDLGDDSDDEKDVAGDADHAVPNDHEDGLTVPAYPGLFWRQPRGRLLQLFALE